MATFFRCRLQFLCYKSQKSELWSYHWKQACGLREVSTNRCSKTPTIDVFEMLLGVPTCWLEPLVPLLRYQMFLIFVSHVSCHFSWIIPKSSLYFFIGNVRLCRSSKSSRILPLFYHHCIPRLIDYQNIAFLGTKRHQFGNGRVVNVNMYVHSGLRWDACHLADRLKAEVL